MNCTRYFANLEIHIYYSGVPRRAGALRCIHCFILYYTIKILFKIHIINLTINALHFMNSAGCVIDLSIHIYYSGAPRQAGALRHICHFIPYYIIKILFKIHIINLMINALYFMNSVRCIIDLSICIYYSGAPR